MGSDHSKELVELPLRDQSKKPFSATEYGHVTEVPTTLRVKRPTFSSTTQFIDPRTFQVVYELKSKTFGSQVTLQTQDGVPLVSMKNRGMFHSGYNVYTRADTDKDVVFTIKEALHSFAPSQLCAEFMDTRTGVLCRLLIEEKYCARAAIVYLERGNPTLAPLEKRELERKSGGNSLQAVGRIQTPRTPMFEREETFIEAAPGVDITVLLLLWKIRLDREEARQRAANSSSSTSAAA